MPVRDVLIIGAGPSGLATAIAARQHNLDYLVVEKGMLVNGIYNFPQHMVFFTTPELLEIGGLPLITPYDKPTRLEALRYYRRVVDTYQLQIAYHERVIAIEREAGGAGEAGRAGRAGGEELFIVTTERGNGTRRVHEARSVVLAIGYYDLPNYLGVPGEDLSHVNHYFTDPHPYYQQRVVVVGGKNSAAEAALELFRAGAKVTLVHRHGTLGDTIKYWVRPDIENRIKEASITGRFNTQVVAITPTAVVVEQDGRREELPAEGVFLMTGYHPDADLMRAAGIHCDETTLKPDMNPETYETNVPGLFLAGGCIAGKNTGAIFIENGRFHGAKIVETIAARFGR